MPRRLLFAFLLGAALAAAGVVAFAEPPKGGFAPDPPAKGSAKQWVFDVRVRRGVVSLEAARPASLDAAVPTARVMGRFAVELHVGRELLDRVRFNVPLMGDEPPERDPRRPFARPPFTDVSTRLRVQLADDPRATYVVLVDRAKGVLQRFWWPPEPDGRLVPLRLDPDGGGLSSAAGEGGTSWDGGAPSARRISSDGGSSPEGGTSSDGGARPGVDAGAGEPGPSGEGGSGAPWRPHPRDTGRR